LAAVREFGSAKVRSGLKAALVSCRLQCLVCPKGDIDRRPPRCYPGDCRLSPNGRLWNVGARRRGPVLIAFVTSHTTGTLLLTKVGFGMRGSLFLARIGWIAAGLPAAMTLRTSDRRVFQFPVDDCPMPREVQSQTKDRRGPSKGPPPE